MEKKETKKEVRHISKFRGRVKALLNLRKEPSLEGEILTTMPKGTVIEYSASKNKEWVKVTYKDFTGYAMVKFIEEAN